MTNFCRGRGKLASKLQYTRQNLVLVLFASVKLTHVATFTTESSPRLVHMHVRADYHLQQQAHLLYDPTCPPESHSTLLYLAPVSRLRPARLVTDCVEV